MKLSIRIIICIFLCFACTGHLSVADNARDYSQHTIEDVEYLGDEIAAVLVDGFCGFIDSDGKLTYSNELYDWNCVRYDSDGLLLRYPIGKNSLESNIDLDFSEGLAAAEANGRYGYIDLEGRKIIPFEYDRAWAFHEGVAPVCKRFNGNEKWGYIDRQGNVLIPFVYDFADSFCEGYAAVEKGDLWGFIDMDGELRIPFQYDAVEEFCEGVAAVGKRNGEDFVWGLIDQTGTEIVPCTYLSDSDSPFFHAGEQLIGVINVAENGSKVGYIDLKGNQVIPFAFDDLVGSWDRSWNDYGYGYFHEGLAVVKDENGYGFINPEGQLVIPCEYEKASSFREGLSLVQKNGKYGIVNQRGELTLPCEYDEMFYETAYADYCFDEQLEWVRKGDKWGAVDLTGRLVIPCEYDAVEPDLKDAGWGQKFDPYKWLKKDGKWGAIDVETKQMILPCEYDYYVWCNDFEDGFVLVWKDGISYLFNDKGQMVQRNDETHHAYALNGGFICYREETENGDSVTIVDNTGKAIMKGSWGRINGFYDGLAWVNPVGISEYGDEPEGNWGLIDDHGNMLVPCEYDKIEYGGGHLYLLKDGRLTILDYVLDKTI